MSNNQKSITLTPSWKAFFWQYFFGVILIPALVGIYLIWKTRKAQNGISYTITDRKITVVDGHISQNIDLADIRKVVAGEKRFGVGSVILKTSGREVELIGLKNPEAISQSIEKAVEAELKRLAAEKEAKPREPEYEPGSMDRLEYLTGLWQQGLMTDEDFKAEKEKLQ
ncbi:PH domain-containing protein [Gracilimonas sediminicola]|uniref:PH domain-containing protein n=1 Tax=Gracilimonas sediminicola TaxID=2952158 RepID=A0A9X2L0V4_9BACT|nr:PH domain-containing protein [Gracilimonas sediminicola]MCP9290209.1 PH domain-containing protein [Gracilimonas sediminicola]